MDDDRNVLHGELGEGAKRPRHIIKLGFMMLLVSTPLVAVAPEPAAGQNWAPFAAGIAGAIVRSIGQGGRPVYPRHYSQRRIVVRGPVHRVVRQEHFAERHHEARTERHDGRVESHEASRVVGKPAVPAIATGGAASAAAATAVVAPAALPAAALATNEITGPTGGSFH